MDTMALDEFGMPPRFFALNRQAYDRLGPVDLGGYEHQVFEAQKLLGIADTEVSFNRSADLQWSIAQCNGALCEQALRLIIVGCTVPLIYMAPNGNAFLVAEWPLERHGSTRLGRVTPTDLRDWTIRSYENFFAAIDDGNVSSPPYLLIRRASGKVIIRRKSVSSELPSVAATEDCDRAFWLRPFQCHWHYAGECSRTVHQLANSAKAE